MEDQIKALEQKVTDLTAAVAQKDSVIAEQNKQIETQKASIIDLELKLAASTGEKAAEVKSAKPSMPKDPVKIGNKSYKYTGPLGFVYENLRYTAEEAVTNPDLVKKILKLPGQTLFQELV